VVAMDRIKLSGISHGNYNRLSWNLNPQQQKDTLLLTTSDANTEASRRLAITKEQRVIYKMQCLPSMFNLEIGQSVVLKHSRFGLSSGKTGVVVGLEPDWMNCKINVKVMV